MLELSVVTKLLAQSAVGVSMFSLAVSGAEVGLPQVADLDLSGSELALDHTPSIINLVPTPKKIRPIVRTSTPEPSAEIDGFLHRYAAEFNLDAGKLHRIANCESHFNPGSVSSKGTYGGMFQFSASTWASTRNAMQLDPDPELRFNAEEAIRTAAWKIAHGGIKAWPVCGQR